MSTVETLLAGLLPLAVQPQIELVRQLPPERVAELAEHALATLAHAGDGLLYRTPDTRQAFVALVDALAVLSFAPGGVAFAGWVWCATHGMTGQREGQPARCPQCVEVAA